MDGAITRLGRHCMPCRVPPQGRQLRMALPLFRFATRALTTVRYAAKHDLTAPSPRADANDLMGYIKAVFGYFEEPQTARFAKQI
jgi:hypothetical protein